jgi:hypothetical protein
MSEEKLNNNWKQKLEDAESLPHAALQNKDDIWEKLHARIAEKPSSKKIIWYWMAAACLLFAVIIPSLTIHRSTTALVKNSAINNANDAVKNAVVQKNKPVEAPAEEITSAQMREQTQKNSVVKNTEQYITTADTVNVIPLVSNDDQPLQNETVATPATFDTTAIATVSPKLMQKKLKVVHINELGEIYEVPADLVRTTDLHLFQLKLAQQEIYNASATASNNTSIVHFLTK